MIKRRINALTNGLTASTGRFIFHSWAGRTLTTTKSYTNVLKYTYIIAYLFMLSGFMFNLTEPRTVFRVQMGMLMSWEDFLLDHIAGMSLYTFSLIGLMGFANKIYEIRSVAIRFGIFFIVALTWFFLIVHFT